MGALASIAGGAAGAAALTLLHETVRKYDDEAPRMDVIGKRAVKKLYRSAGLPAPVGEELYYTTLGGDLLANAAYYSAVGAAGKGRSWALGTALGLMAGLGAVFLPERLGLGKPVREHNRSTQLKTVAWYLAGGIVAAAVFEALSSDKE